MRSRTTLFLAIVTAAVGYVILRTDHEVPTTREREAKLLHPLVIDPLQIDGIEIETGESLISLQLKGRAWRVAKPWADLADPEQVTAILQAIPSAEWIEPLKPAEMQSAMWAATGLDKPTSHIRYTSAGELRGEVWLGNSSAIEGATYLSIPGDGDERAHYVVRTALPTVLKKPIEQWRDSKLLHVPAETISRIVMKNGHGQIELVRDKPKAPWELVKPLQTHGYNERVNELVATLLDLKIVSIIPAAGLKTAPAAEALHLTLTSAALPEPVDLTISPPAEAKGKQTSATSSLRGSGFTISSERLASLWVSVNEVRDPHLARIDAEQVDGIRVTGASVSEVELRKDYDHWMLQRHGQWEPASGERVAKVISALNEAPVLEFVSDSASDLESYGLKTPLLTVGWNDPRMDVNYKQASTAGGDFSATPLKGVATSLLFGTNKEGTLYAKYEDAPFIYRVGASILNALPRDGSRWKALNPVRFTQFALKRIALSVGTAPPVVLDYNPKTGAWAGSVAGKEVTAQIDQVKADQLTSKLASLQVQDWLQDRTDGVKALATPAITIQLALLNDTTKPEGSTKMLALNFSPTQPGADTPFYYGRVDSSPDIFLYSRDALRELLKSVMKPVP
jgi:hypothetical protein